MSVKFANNAFGTLNAGISNSATSITLSSGQGARFPSLSAGEYFYATLIDTSNNLEVVKCTARSTDVLTVTRAQESTTAQAFAIGDRIELRITAGGLTDAANPYDKDTSSTGSFALPSGTTAQQPTAADSEGHIRYDTDDSVVYYSDGSNWLKISSVISTLSSAAGNIYDGAESTLTLAGKGFQTANLVVNFFQASDSIDEDVTVTPTSDTAATVTVPAAVYNNVTSGNLMSVTVTNSDGITSAAVTKTALALPSGGTVTTSGNFRIHTFTSSGTFTNTVASLSVEYLVVAGGGGGATDADVGGGGGAGGLLTGNTNVTAQAYSVVVGAGGAGGTNAYTPGTGGGGNGAQGSNSSALGLTAIGGGYGGTRNINGGSGGSGGGGGDGGTTGGAGTAGQGNTGGNGGGVGFNQNSGNDQGAGGGAGGAGNVWTPGPGAASSISGTAITYAAGGRGMGSTTAAANTGNGGRGSATTADSTGGSGVVIIRYTL